MTEDNIDSEVTVGIVIQEKQEELKKVNSVLRRYTTRMKNLTKQIHDLLHVKNQARIYTKVSDIKDEFSTDDLKMLRKLKRLEEIKNEVEEDNQTEN